MPDKDKLDELARKAELGHVFTRDEILWSVRTARLYRSMYEMEREAVLRLSKPAEPEPGDITYAFHNGSTWTISSKVQP